MTSTQAWILLGLLSVGLAYYMDNSGANVFQVAIVSTLSAAFAAAALYTALGKRA